MNVNLIQRKPQPGQFSFEGYFARVMEAFSSLNFDAALKIVPYRSIGLIPRLGILAYARRNSGAVTHITGDIHFAAMVLNPERTVVTVHDCGSLHKLQGLKREVMRQLWFNLPLRRLGAITVVSNETKRDLLKWVPSLDPERIHVIPVSVSALFSRADKEFNSENPRVLQVGTKENKNLLRLCEALEGLKCHLVIVGVLTNRQKAALAKHQIDYTNLIGLSDEELVKEYQKADILAFASTFEGFGMPIVEAQIVGRPVVTSDCASMPEVAGDGAVLVDPYSVESIRDGFRKIIGDSNLREQLVNIGFENARRFDNTEIAKKYIAIYGSLQRQH